MSEDSPVTAVRQNLALLLVSAVLFMLAALNLFQAIQWTNRVSTELSALHSLTANTQEEWEIIKRGAIRGEAAAAYLERNAAGAAEALAAETEEEEE